MAVGLFQMRWDKVEGSGVANSVLAGTATGVPPKQIIIADRARRSGGPQPRLRTGSPHDGHSDPEPDADHALGPGSQPGPLTAARW